MLHFIDYEVFSKDWLCVIINPVTKTETVIVNDPEKLTKYYEKYKNEIFVTYNGRNYDQYIFKAILTGFDPKKVNDFIIVAGKKGYQYSSLFNKFPINNYDVMTSFHSLKQLEGFMGHDIRESGVPWDIDRKLTDNELEETISYCRHDVMQTIEVFLQRKEEFDSHLNLIKAFSLPLSYISKTKTQLSAIILGANKKEHYDEFEITFPDTMRIEKYTDVVDWYGNHVNRDYDKTLEINISKVPHTFAWGGLHGAIQNYAGVGYFVNIDVASYYPALMIEYNFISRNISNPNKYREIRDTRLKLKAEKNPMQAPYKIVLNATYGGMKDKYSNLYDPMNANNVCVGGQLLLLDLIEKLDGHCQLIQSNTDGILIKLYSPDDFEKIDDICHSWERRTRMELEFESFYKVYQRDVNNYVLVDFKGKYKSKGAVVKKLSDLDYDLPIINKAVINFILHGIPVERTINACDDLIEFQKVVKVSSKYLQALHGNTILPEKTLRVFASTNNRDGGVFKRKDIHANKEKFANTPEHCFIENGNIIGKKVDDYPLDKNWYIEIAKDRLEGFV